MPSSSASTCLASKSWPLTVTHTSPSSMYAGASSFHCAFVSKELEGLRQDSGRSLGPNGCWGDGGGFGGGGEGSAGPCEAE
eukprot:scaffold248741_cov23-Tisochrysis_lutea.AAC.1